MPKYRLMTPGPTQVPEASLLRLAEQVTHHRTPEFRGLLAEVLDGLKYVFQTTGDVLVLTSSGTGAMEAAVASVVSARGEGDRPGVGQVLRAVAKTLRAVRHRGGSPRDSLGRGVRRRRRRPTAWRNIPTRWPFTRRFPRRSTGVGHDIEAIGRVVKPTDALLVVDGISGVGVMECRTDEWGIDLLVVGSQKALMAPPGLAFVAVSPKAWRQIESIEPQAFYFDLRAYRASLAGPDTPFTPARSLVAALAENLRQIRGEGIEAVWARGRLLARAARAGVTALGLKLVASRPADGLTAAYLPAGIDARTFSRPTGAAIRRQAGRGARPLGRQDIPDGPPGHDRRVGHPFGPGRHRTGPGRDWATRSSWAPASPPRVECSPDGKGKNRECAKGRSVEARQQNARHCDLGRYHVPVLRSAENQGGSQSCRRGGKCAPRGGGETIPCERAITSKAKRGFIEWQKSSFSTRCRRTAWTCWTRPEASSTKFAPA